MVSDEAPAGPRRSGLALGLTRAGLWLLALPKPAVAFLSVAWMGVIWILSAQSLPVRAGGSGIWKLLGNGFHAPAFGLLCLLVCALVLRREPGGNWRLVARDAFLVLGVVAAYGVLDEWHQSSTPGRHPSVSDIVTDVVGAVCVLWIVAYLGRAHITHRGLVLRLLGGIGLCLGSVSLSLVGSF